MSDRAMTFEDLIALIAAPIYAQMAGDISGHGPHIRAEALGYAYELWKEAQRKPWEPYEKPR